MEDKENPVSGRTDGLSQDYNGKLGKWFADRLGAREQVAALEVDALRYRWLRDVARTVDWTQYIKDTAYVCHCRIGPQGMDAAIDAALAALGDAK